MSSSGSRSTLAWVLVGALIGATVGFLFRPAVPLVGQLDLVTVLTRGARLTGLDTMLQPAAERSFNYMAGGGLAGAALLGVAARLFKR
jgi:hypothetical protein